METDRHVHVKRSLIVWSYIAACHGPPPLPWGSLPPHALPLGPSHSASTNILKF